MITNNYIIKNKPKAVELVGRKVMNKEGPLKIYTLPLRTSGLQIGQVFHVLSATSPSSNPFPLLIHCTHGKDRTGLLITLILLSLRIDPELIDEDYWKSKDELAATREKRVEEVNKNMGLKQDFADCCEGFVDKVVKDVGGKEGVDAWLEKEARVTKKEISVIREMLLDSNGGRKG